MFNRRTILGALSALALMSATAPAFAQEKYDIALISKGFQHQFWQAVKAGADKAAAEFGVADIGFNAMLSLRIEKSFGVWSKEFTQLYTPGETGMDRWIDWTKPDFTGKQATLDAPVRLRLMQAVLGRFFNAVLVASALVLGELETDAADALSGQVAEGSALVATAYTGMPSFLSGAARGDRGHVPRSRVRRGLDLRGPGPRAARPVVGDDRAGRARPRHRAVDRHVG